MPWCPNCKTEYQDGYTVCSDCGSTLVESLEQAAAEEAAEYSRDAAALFPDDTGFETEEIQEAQEETSSDYSFHYQSEDGKVTISAEADVLLPETERIPMYQVSCQGFPQEQVTAIYDYLFQGESTWYDPDNWYCTKAMADADLEDDRMAETASGICEDSSVGICTTAFYQFMQ